MIRLRGMQWIVGRIQALTLQQVWLLSLTFFVLLTARVALRVVPVKRILRWQQRPPGVVKLPAKWPAGLALQEVRWAVMTVCRRSPIRFVCFPQCLAGSFLLRRKGIGSRLHYGVARSGAGLETHTWLESGGIVLLGAEERERFQEIAVYG